jgi:hypothetical protein
MIQEMSQSLIAILKEKLHQVKQLLLEPVPKTRRNGDGILKKALPQLNTDIKT